MSERWAVVVDVDPAPDGFGPEFFAWCDKYGFTPISSGRRAWCGSLSSYLRGAYGVASCDGEMFLVHRDDLLPVGGAS